MNPDTDATWREVRDASKAWTARNRKLTDLKNK
jgi:hypothetical protein